MLWRRVGRKPGTDGASGRVSHWRRPSRIQKEFPPFLYANVHQPFPVAFKTSRPLSLLNTERRVPSYRPGFFIWVSRTDSQLGLYLFSPSEFCTNGLSPAQVREGIPRCLTGRQGTFRCAHHEREKSTHVNQLRKHGGDTCVVPRDRCRTIGGRGAGAGAGSTGTAPWPGSTSSTPIVTISFFVRTCCAKGNEPQSRSGLPCRGRGYPPRRSEPGNADRRGVLGIRWGSDTNTSGHHM